MTADVEGRTSIKLHRVARERFVVNLGVFLVWAKTVLLSLIYAGGCCSLSFSSALLPGRKGFQKLVRVQMIALLVSLTLDIFLLSRWPLGRCMIVMYVIFLERELRGVDLQPSWGLLGVLFNLAGVSLYFRDMLWK